MKNLLSLFVLSTLFLLSCDKDPTIKEQLTATWNLSSFVIDGDEQIGMQTYNTTDIDSAGNIIPVVTVETTTGTIEFQAAGTVALTTITEYSRSTGEMGTDTETALGTFEVADDKSLTLIFPNVDGERYDFAGTIGILTDSDFQYSGTVIADSDPSTETLFNISASK